MASASQEGERLNQQRQETGGSMERAPMGEVSEEYLQAPQTSETSFLKYRTYHLRWRGILIER